MWGWTRLPVTLPLGLELFSTHPGEGPSSGWVWDGELLDPGAWQPPQGPAASCDLPPEAPGPGSPRSLNQPPGSGEGGPNYERKD